MPTFRVTALSKIWGMSQRFKLNAMSEKEARKKFKADNPHTIITRVKWMTRKDEKIKGIEVDPCRYHRWIWDEDWYRCSKCGMSVAGYDYARVARLVKTRGDVEVQARIRRLNR